MTDYDSIGDELRTHFATDGRLLGSKLGAWFKQNHPEVDLAVAGGLKAFLSSNLSSYLVSIGKDEISRVDDRYCLIGTNGPTQSPPLHRPPPSNEVDPRIWDAFVNPTSAFKNKLLIAHSRLVIDDTSNAAMEAGVALPTVTYAEERAIYERFADIETSPAKAALDRALRSETYQQAWYRELGSSDVGGLGKRWGRYRHEELLKIFDARIDQVGLATDAKHALREQLLECFQANRVVRKSTQASRPAAAIEPSLRDELARHARSDSESFAHAAIQHMSEAELMQLSIPLHAALKVLNAAKR